MIYAAAAERYDALQRESDGYELDARLLPLNTVAALPLSQAERVLLAAAMD